MLSSVNLNDKSYEELLAEALGAIPLYSEEWSNFNVSDPGITILENLTSFNLLQQSYINEVSDAVRRKLLKLVGFEAVDYVSARALIEASSPDVITLPAQKKLMAGELCFETSEPVVIRPWGLRAVFAYRDNAYRDITFLLDRDVPGGANVFGAQPEKGCGFYCILSDLPEPERPLHLYIRTLDDDKRAPFEDGSDLRFADLIWQCYTEKGWQDVAVRDDTHSLLMSGEVRLSPPEAPPAVFLDAPEHGYAVRCIVRSAEYDIPPRLHSITVNLFEAVQRDSRVKSHCFMGKNRIELFSGLAMYDCEFVYCREEKGEPYRLYSMYISGDEYGRYYTKTVLPDGGIAIEFNKRRFGFGPHRRKDAVRVVCCDDEMVHHRRLETVYGYENQVIDIDLVTRILPDDFCLVAETVDAGGERAYEFIRPGRQGHSTLCYDVRSEPGEICITNPGMGEDCVLYLADCATSGGAAGNIRPGNSLVPRESGADTRGVRFQNVSPGRGGLSYESTEQLRKRFVADMRRASSAVMAADYEEIVKRTPGLCIHKVSAAADRENGLVKIAIKPYTDSKLPVMSPLYVRQITRCLERRRVITTKVELVQPRYIPVDVYATLYVKSYYENARERIEAALTGALDQVTTDCPFGEPIRFNAIYRMLEQMDCVEAVFDLSLIPRARGDVSMLGSDIVPGGNCLCHAGRLSLKISTQSGSAL